MMNKKDGGPAFPEMIKTNYYSGMRLRDYFAAKAMQGILSAESRDVAYPSDKLATWSYQIADAMIEEREK